MALTVNTQVNSNGVVQLTTGNITTDAGAAAVTTITLGFSPRVVRFRNVTDRITDEWYSGMASASSIHTVAVGTVTLDLVNGIAVAGNTFTVTATTMVASKVYVWEAYA